MIVASSCFPSLGFKLVTDFVFLYKKKLYKHSETETARRTSQEQIEYGIINRFVYVSPKDRDWQSLPSKSS